MSVSLKLASWFNQKERELIQTIRRRVFIEEQHVPEEMEWDDDDEHAIHCLAFIDEKAVGTGRLLKTGQIGRMAVLKNYRNRGIGIRILRLLITEHRKHSDRDIFIHAQTHALRFYKQVGFVAFGEEFDEAGIPHYEMILKNE